MDPDAFSLAVVDLIHHFLIINSAPDNFLDLNCNDHGKPHHDSTPD